MGTSGAYTGAGGKAGKEIGEGLSDWLDSLPGKPDGGDSTPSSDGTEEGNKPDYTASAKGRQRAHGFAPASIH